MTYNKQTLFTPSQQLSVNQGFTRNNTITIAKGICIILMVMGHSGVPQPLSRFLYVFHMPLFFVVAGYCFKAAYLNTPVKFTRRRLKGLWLPFVKWNLIFVLLHNLLYTIGIYENEYSIPMIAKKMITTLIFGIPEDMLGGFWFFRCLFFASLISWGILWVSRCKVHVIAIAIAVMLISVMIINEFFVESYPFLALPSVSLRSSIYFLSGYILKYLHDRHGSTRQRNILTSIICLFIVGTVSIIAPGQILDNSSWVLPLRYIGAIAGCIGVLLLSAQIRDGKLKKFLTFCGDSTILILVWHFLCLKLVTFCIINIHDLPITDLTQFPILQQFKAYYWPLYVFAGLAIPLLIQYCYNKIKPRIPSKHFRKTPINT